MAGEGKDAPLPDPAAETGRLAGRAVNALGLRLLRTRLVRRAIRRGVEEASGPDAPHPEPPPEGREAS